VFRYVDKKNYYIFEMKKNEKSGQKRIRKFVNGISTTLLEKEDGGYL